MRLGRDTSEHVQPSYTHSSEYTVTEIAALSAGFRALGDDYERVGVTFEEAGAAILTLQATGMSPGVAGRNLGVLINDIAAPAKRLTDASTLRGLGLGSDAFRQRGLYWTIAPIAYRGVKAGQLDEWFGVPRASVAQGLLDHPVLYRGALAKLEGPNDDEPVSTRDAVLKWLENFLLDDPVSRLADLPLLGKWLKRLHRWITQQRARARDRYRTPGTPDVLRPALRGLARRAAGVIAAILAGAAGAWTAFGALRRCDSDSVAEASHGAASASRAFAGAAATASASPLRRSDSLWAQDGPKESGRVGRATAPPLAGPFSAGGRRGPDPAGKLEGSGQKWGGRALRPMTEWFQRFTRSVTDAMAPVVATLTDTASGAYDFAAQSAGQALTFTRDTASSALHWLSRHLDRAGEFLRERVGLVVRPASEWCDRIVTPVADCSGAAVTAVEEWCDRVLSLIERWSGSTVTATEQWCDRMVTPIEKCVSEMTIRLRARASSSMIRAAQWADDAIVRIDQWLENLTGRDRDKPRTSAAAHVRGERARMSVTRGSTRASITRRAVTYAATPAAARRPVLAPPSSHRVVCTRDEVISLIANQLNRAMRSAGYSG